MAADFAGIVGALSNGGVDVILIGGLAAQAHGSARVTQDTDFLYRRTNDNIERLVATLAEHAPYLRGAPAGLPFRFDSATVKRGLNFTLTTDLGDVDLLGEVAGIGDYEAVVAHTQRLSVFGCDLLVVDLPTLIRSKRAAGRPKDLEAIAELEALLAERERS
ncbi:MAG TPA: hypothetical protein VHJ20_01390 [Polyangia bacterium]|nr:hypothetical protein [Polyangia bacterium]